MSIAVSASNVLWGALFVYVARLVVAKSEAAKVEKEKDGFKVEMKDVAPGLKGADVVAQGPYAQWL